MYLNGLFDINRMQLYINFCGIEEIVDINAIQKIFPTKIHEILI